MLAAVVSDFLTAVEREAGLAGVTVRHALPVTGNMLVRAVDLLRARANTPGRTLLRILADRQLIFYLSVLEQCDRRGGCLTKSRTPCWVLTPDRDRLIVTFTTGKTARVKTPDRFVLRRTGGALCPFVTRDAYMAACVACGVSLASGSPYVFFHIDLRSTRPLSLVSHASAEMMNSRFKECMSSVTGAPSLHSIHGVRVGGALVARWAGADEASLLAVRLAGGWMTDDSARRYSKYALVVADSSLSPAEKLEVLSDWLSSAPEFRFFV